MKADRSSLREILQEAETVLAGIQSLLLVQPKIPIVENTQETICSVERCIHALHQIVVFICQQSGIFPFEEFGQHVSVGALEPLPRNSN